MVSKDVRPKHIGHISGTMHDEPIDWKETRLTTRLGEHEAKVVC